MEKVYASHKDEDGFLYLVYTDHESLGVWIKNILLNK